MPGPTPFDQWSADLQAICGAYVGVARRGQRQVAGGIGVHAFADLDVAEVCGDVDRIERGPRDIRSDPREHIFFVMGVGGRLGLEHAGHATALAAGDAVLLDSTRTATLRIGEAPVRLLSVHLPRQTFLANRRPGLRLGERMGAEGPALAAALRQFRRFFRPGAGAEGGAADATGDRDARVRLLSDLIHNAFCRPGAGLSDLDLTCAADRYRLALDLIDAHLPSDELSLPWLAARLGLSARSLQRLFHDRGTSFSALVRAKRLRLVREQLDRRLSVHGSIAELAFRAGFRDLSNFNRAFRAAFGVSPRDYHRQRPAGASGWREMPRTAGPAVAG